jgi:hypothetical protein
MVERVTSNDEVAGSIPSEGIEYAAWVVLFDDFFEYSGDVEVVEDIFLEVLIIFLGRCGG